MSEQEERRALSARYRVLTTTGEEQSRALKRLTRLTDISIAFEVWLLTKPDPELVKKVQDAILTYLMRQYMPFRSMSAKPIEGLLPKPQSLTFSHVVYRDKAQLGGLS